MVLSGSKIQKITVVAKTMSDNSSSRAKAKYDKKRKGTPRFGGYCTQDEKSLFKATKKLAGVNSEKAMFILAVEKLNESLSMQQN